MYGVFYREKHQDDHLRANFDFKADKELWQRLVRRIVPSWAAFLAVVLPVLASNSGRLPTNGSTYRELYARWLDEYETNYAAQFKEQNPPPERPTPERLVSTTDPNARGSRQQRRERDARRHARNKRQRAAEAASPARGENEAGAPL